MLSAENLMPVLRFEDFYPMHVEAQLVGVAPSACQPPAEIRVRRFFGQAHLVVGWKAAADQASGGARDLDPIVHIVRFEDAGGTETILRDETHKVLDFRRRRFVDDRPAPDFHFVRSSRMPNAKRTREPVKRKIGKN